MLDRIRQLPPILINRIAAGEVIEKPASVVKELVENALDAGSSTIEIIIKNGGKSYISIKDNGSGMSRKDLDLSVERHTTSKLPFDDLINIKNFGFRGEALASIASVARLKISSFDAKLNEGYEIKVEAGKKYPLIPSSIQRGTRVEIEDLFFATPARLKFLKNNESEKRAIIERVKTFILANENVDFSLIIDDKEIFKSTPSRLNLPEANLEERIKKILGKDFLENSILVSEQREYLGLEAYISLPTYNAPNTSDQYIFVNKRPLKDKLISLAIKIAYQDVIPRGRYPILLMNITIPSEFVDVNVHPAKSEVRFQDENLVRGFIISSIKNALFQKSQFASSHIGSVAEQKIVENIKFSFPEKSPERTYNFIESVFAEKEETPYKNLSSPKLPQTNLHLGYALCQFNNSYIIAQTGEEMVIVDQHAAHERIVYEDLKIKFEASEKKLQKLLIPEIIEFNFGDIEFILSKQKELEDLGFKFSEFGENAIELKQIPAIFANYNIPKFFKDIISDIKTSNTINSHDKLLEHILETAACHNSIRQGRKMNIEEMNALLRLIEKTPQSAQCNHGRPTYLKLSLKNLESLFERA